jgi:hypothetical protein
VSFELVESITCIVVPFPYEDSLTHVFWAPVDPFVDGSERPSEPGEVERPGKNN